MIEVRLFFTWLVVSIMFTLYAYVFKIKSISKSDIVMESDDNVWNDKDTDDFLRYLKFEYFMVSYTLLKMCMEILIGFFPQSVELVFGKNDFYPVGIIFILLLGNSLIAMANTTYMLRNVDDHQGFEEAAN